MSLTPGVSCISQGKFIKSFSSASFDISSRQHNVIPEKTLLSEVTHVALAFMRSDTFNQAQPTTWPLFTTIETVRSQFPLGTAVMVAIGGWGDTSGFSQAAATDSSRRLFAGNVKAMVEATGADGALRQGRFVACTY